MPATTPVFEYVQPYYAGEMIPLLDDYKQKIDDLKGKELSHEELYQAAERLQQEFKQTLDLYNDQASYALERTVRLNAAINCGMS